VVGCKTRRSRTAFPIRTFYELKRSTHLFNRQRVDQLMQFRPFRFYDRSRKRVLCEERKTFHAATFFLNGGVCRIVLRHLRTHVPDDGLNDRQRHPSHSGEVAERVTTRMQVFHADRPRPSLRLACSLDPQPFEELFHPVRAGNSATTRLVLPTARTNGKI